MDELQSPVDSAEALARRSEDEQSPAIPSEDYMTVKVYFFSEDKHLKKKIFDDEWYIVAREMIDAELKEEDTVYFEVSSEECCLTLHAV